MIAERHHNTSIYFSGLKTHTPTAMASISTFATELKRSERTMSEKQQQQRKKFLGKCLLFMFSFSVEKRVRSTRIEA